MILLLGATGYVGQAFARALRIRKDSFIPLSLDTFDYARFEFLLDYVRKVHPDLVINATGTLDNPVSDAGELDRMEMLQTNTLLPQTIARVCALTNTPWGHVSSGSIYTGAKILENGKYRVEPDLSRPSIRELFAAHPERFCGFSELDEPNFSFKNAPCNFYSGTKALAEEALSQAQCYLWRLRLPFNEVDEPANFLSQLQDGFKLQHAINSLSQLDDCVRACLELWERRAAFGIYNVVNPGAVSSQEVFQKIQRFLKPANRFPITVYAPGADRPSPRADCILDVSKLLKCGVKLPSVQKALEKSLEQWRPQAASALRTTAWDA